MLYLSQDDNPYHWGFIRCYDMFFPGRRGSTPGDQKHPKNRHSFTQKRPPSIVLEKCTRDLSKMCRTVPDNWLKPFIQYQKSFPIPSPTKKTGWKVMDPQKLLITHPITELGCSWSMQQKKVGCKQHIFCWPSFFQQVQCHVFCWSFSIL